jgi:hypothetical protein
MSNGLPGHNEGERRGGIQVREGRDTGETIGFTCHTKREKGIYVYI